MPKPPTHFPRPASTRLHRLTHPWFAALLLALFYVVLLASLRDKSATFDEPGHAAAGYVYWKFGDYRLDPENGNLPKRWFALPFLFRSDRFPPVDSSGGAPPNLWLLSDSWFNRLGNDAAAMLATGRAVAALIAVALGIVVWFWARHLFGPLGGLLTLLLYILNPTILANGGLMTSDTAAALGFLAALGCIWATLQRITAARVLGGTVAIAGLFLAKMSAVLILPIALVLALARLVDGRPLPFGSRRLLTRRAHQAVALATVALLQTLGVVALVWSAYGFRYTAASPSVTAPAPFQNPWEWALGHPPPRDLLAQLELGPEQQTAAARLIHRSGYKNPEWSHPIAADLDALARHVLTPAQAARLRDLRARAPDHFIPRLIHFAREHRLLPESFLFGYAHVWKTSDRLIAFFNGEIRDTGWRTFFPFAFAVKTPLPFLALLVLAAVAGLLALRRAPLWSTVYPILPLLLLVLVYGTAALLSHLNIGHRHLLPLYPPLLIFAGGCAAWLTAPATASASPRRSRLLRFAILALLAAHVVETAYRFPNYITYFNGLVSPSRAYRHLVDSSLDWGQELPAIARYLAAHPQEPAHLAYFGIGSPAAHGIRAKFLGGFPAIDRKTLPAFHPLLNTTTENVRAFLAAHPEFDPDIVFKLDGDQPFTALLLHRSSAHRLEPGLYLVSATMLPPLYHGKVDTFWNATHERHYQSLRRTLRPFLEDDKAAKLSVTTTRPYPEWLSLFDDYYNFRLSRLTAFLRLREPDDTINHSVLVYRLTQADLDRALDGPSP